MMREANVAGVFFSPLLIYMAAALVLYLPLRMVLVRLGFVRWVWNPPLAEAGVYLWILGVLVVLL